MTQTAVSHKCFNPFPNNKFETLPNRKTLQMTILTLLNKAESSPNGLKTLWEKEKLLVTSNFSFSHSVFKRLVMQTRKNHDLFGKRLSSRGDYPSTSGRRCLKTASGTTSIHDNGYQHFLHFQQWLQ